MNKKIITTPINDPDIKTLAIGDIVYLTGYLITARDDVHQRLIKQHRQLPFDLSGMAIFHAGPIMQAVEEHPGKYQVISIGPTTSMRMEEYEQQFIHKTGVKLIIGKGGMGAKTAEGCRKHTAIHTVFPGGCAVLAANCVEADERVEWLDLGMPEAMWAMKVKEFGPLIVSIDTRGNNLFENKKPEFDARKDAAIEKIRPITNYLE